MPDNNSPLASAVNNPLKALSFDHIIGGPLRSCAEAQQEAALASYDYLKAMGLEPDPTGMGRFRPTMLSFYFTKDGNTHKVSIPLLSVVPVPYLLIDRVHLSFQATVTGCEQGSLTAQFAATTAQVKREANSSSTGSITAKENIDINICASASDVPSGMAKLIEILQTQMTDISDYK